MDYILNLFNSSLTDHSWIGYLVFFIVSYINVVLQNIKNIYVIKATKRQASTIGMITSAFYVGVVVLITYHGLISFIIVPIAHFLGIYTAKSVCESLEKKGKLNKKVWVFSHTFRYVSYFFTKNKLFSPSKDF